MKRIKQFILNINFSRVSAGAVTRLVMLLLSLVFYLMKIFHLVPPAIDEDLVCNLIIAFFGVLAFLQSYWKNNSWTFAAQQADEIMEQLKENGSL